MQNARVRSLGFLFVSAVSFTPTFAVETPTFPHSPDPAAVFRDALTARDLELELMLNAVPTNVMEKARAGKEDIRAQKTVGLFGSIRNNLGVPVCGLVLANGQFMFSCAPAGSFTLEAPVDGAGQITLFGFAEGHFPWKSVVMSGGRYDLTLNIATVTPPPVSESVISFTITDQCNNGIQIEYKFYDVTNNLVWPSATTHYTTQYYGASYTHNLRCRTGANVCYGARSANFYWGIDRDGSKSCPDCCISCVNGYSLSRRLTC